MIALSQCFPPLVPKISVMGLPRLEICLTTRCVKKQKSFSDLNFVMLHFCWLFPALLLMRSCHPPFSTPLIIVSDAPVAVVAQGFLGAMGFVSAL